MAFIPPVAAIRRAMIIRKLKACGAVSPETAKTFSEAKIPNPNGFRPITRVLLSRGILKETPDGKYYLNPSRN